MQSALNVAREPRNYSVLCAYNIVMYLILLLDQFY